MYALDGVVRCDGFGSYTVTIYLHTPERAAPYAVILDDEDLTPVTWSSGTRLTVRLRHIDPVAEARIVLALDAADWPLETESV